MSLQVQSKLKLSSIDSIYLVSVSTPRAAYQRGVHMLCGAYSRICGAYVRPRLETRACSAYAERRKNHEVGGSSGHR